jgi:flagellar hook assembly protein FlgD
MNGKNLTPLAFAFVALAMTTAEAAKLENNCPNPFNSETCIAFELQKTQQVRLEVFDLKGRRVRVLVDGDVLEANRYEKFWDGRNEDGRGVSSGMYVYRLTTSDSQATKKMLLTR